jgi:hypothetical protein
VDSGQKVFLFLSLPNFTYPSSVIPAHAGIHLQMVTLTNMLQQKEIMVVIKQQRLLL